MLTLAGLLAAVIVFPLGDSDAASFVMSLPVFLQVIISRIPDGTPIQLLMLPGILIIVAGYAFIRRGRRHFVTASGARGQLPGSDTILYLRPFDADTSPLPSLLTRESFFLLETKLWTTAWLVLRGNTRYEELLTYAFRRLGRIVTLGDPKERLPQLGASRMYAPSGRPGSSGGEEWKTVVAEQIARAKLILLHVGISSGLHWEVETVIAAADPLHVLLCINPAGKPKKRIRNILDSARRREVDATWREFREALGAFFPRGLPETLGDCRFVRFDAGWTAIPVQVTKRRLAWFVPTRPRWPGRDTIDGVLAWLLWLMIPEPLARKMARRTINFATFMVAFLGVITAIVMMATH
jgi:hypothetical protein